MSDLPSRNAALFCPVLRHRTCPHCGWLPNSGAPTVGSGSSVSNAVSARRHHQPCCRASWVWRTVHCCFERLIRQRLSGAFKVAEMQLHPFGLCGALALTPVRCCTVSTARSVVASVGQAYPLRFLRSKSSVRPWAVECMATSWSCAPAVAERARVPLSSHCAVPQALSTAVCSSLDAAQRPHRRCAAVVFFHGARQLASSARVQSSVRHPTPAGHPSSIGRSPCGLVCFVAVVCVRARGARRPYPKQWSGCFFTASVHAYYLY